MTSDARIETIRGVEPNEEQGGKLVNGMIVGPTRPVIRWRVKGEAKLYYSRNEVNTELKRRDCHSALFESLGFLEKESLTPQQVILSVMRNSDRLKKVLTSKKFASCLQ